MPSSARTSRTCLLLTSSSRARSLIRTLLIRLFSEFLFPMHSVAHGCLVAWVVSRNCVIVGFDWRDGAHTMRHPLQPLSLRLPLRLLQPRPHLPCRGRSDLQLPSQLQRWQFHPAPPANFPLQLPRYPQQLPESAAQLRLLQSGQSSAAPRPRSSRASFRRCLEFLQAVRESYRPALPPW